MIQIIALLYASENGMNGLREFESKAIPILREHHGILLSASSSSQKSQNEPDEIHIIQFPSMKEFDDYKNDQRLLDLKSLKETMIHKMELHITDQFYEYK